MKFETTTDILEYSLQLKEEAKKIDNERAHGQWWDRKVDHLHYINGLLETGGFDGQGYDELWAAKQALFTGEAYAGRYANSL